MNRTRHRLVYLLAVAAAALAIGLPFAALNATMLTASFHAMVSRSSWETIWALFEGYFSFGKVAPLADRFIPETAGWQSHAAQLPWIWIEAGFLLLYLLIWTT